MPPKRGKQNKRKKYNRVNKRRKRIQKPLALKPHNFVERFEENIRLDNTIVNSSGNLTTTSTKKFSFDMIAQHASYAELFDEQVKM